MAELDRFDRTLRASASATAMLTRWVRERSGRPSATLSARRVPIPVPAPDPALVRRLGVDGPEEIVCRRVRLMDAGRVLSDAFNFYVPARLTAAMRTMLEQTDIPFGTVIAPLSPTRETLLVEHYRSSGEGAPPAGRRLPTRLMRHDALLRDTQGLPLCVVSEVYTRNILS